MNTDYRDHIRTLTADVLNGKRTLESLQLGREFFLVQQVLWKMNKPELVKEMATLASQRLVAKGYIHVTGVGWYKRSDLATAGINLNGSVNPDKYRTYLQRLAEAKYRKRTEQTTLER